VALLLRKLRLTLRTRVPPANMLKTEPSIRMPGGNSQEN